MKIIKNSQSLALCMLVLGTAIQTETMAKNDNSIAITQEDFGEKGLLKAFGQLQQIDTSIAQLALLIANGTIKIDNPKKTITIFRDIRGIIGSLAKDQAAIIAMKKPELNEQLTAALTHICDELILYLEKGLNNKLIGLKPFDLEKLTKRGIAKKPTRSAIKQNLQKIDTKLESLKHSINNAGLTWYNKLARTADKWIVTPANNYHVPTIAYYGGGTAIVAGYALWRFGHIFKDPKNPNAPTAGLSKISENLRDCLGKPWHNDPHTGNPTEIGSKDNGDLGNASLIAFADYTTLDFMSHNPIMTLLGGYLFKSFIEEKLPQLKNKFNEKRDDVWNYLRGGSFLQQSSPGIYSIEPRVNFDHMVGLDEVKEQFSTIIQYLDNPELLANMHASPEKGWLLTGEKRTGKSFSFECLCGEIVRMQKAKGQKNKFTFWNIDASLIHEKGIKTILYYAQEEGPMVLFIDEIDLLNLNRVGDTKLLNEFLTALQSSMDQDPSKVIIVIAATNKPQTLDPALRANGRFGKEIRFEYPAKKYRVEFITKELTNMALDVRQFDIERLAEKTDQKSFEDLRAIIRNAMTRAWSFSQTLTQEYLETSIDTEIHHIIMTDRKDLPEHENRILASHFAGRALATLYLPMNAKLDKVTIHARMTDLSEEAQWSELYKDKEDKDKDKKIEHGHLTTRLLNDSIHVKSEEYILNEAKALIAGFIAEELLLDSCGFSCHAKEHERAYKLIEQLVFGRIDPKLVAKNISEQLKQKAFDLLQQCKAEVKQLLKEHQAALGAIADALMAKRILTDKEIQTIIDKAEGKIVEKIVTEATEDNTTNTDAKTTSELTSAPTE